MGNVIGLALGGTKGLGNNGDGILLQGASSNTVGGTTTLAVNTITANAGNGINIVGGSVNLVDGNVIGNIVPDNTAYPGNALSGVSISGGATGNGIGSNVISGNSANGVVISGQGTNGNILVNNAIGTDSGLAHAVPNGTPGTNANGVGVLIENGASGNTIGGPLANFNIISGNLSAGVQISGQGTSGNLVSGNQIGTGAGGKSAVPNGNPRTSFSGVGVLINAGASDNTIGGATKGFVNVMSGNIYAGVQISGQGTSGNIIESNLIGTDGTGSNALANGVPGLVQSGVGILINLGASGNLIGGTVAGSGNVVSGNLGPGIDIDGSGTSGNIVQRNLIGLNSTGGAPVPNQSDGVTIDMGATGNTVGGTASGAGNQIAYNFGNGVTVGSSSTDASTGNSILENEIFGNQSLGIDLGNNGVTENDSSGHAGPNLFQDFPVLSYAAITSILEPTNPVTTVYGTVHGPANSNIRVEFFADNAADPSGYGQGLTFLGSVTQPADANGHMQFTFNSTQVSKTAFISATATDANGNTSEFSQDVKVQTPVISILPPSPPTLLAADDTGTPGNGVTEVTSPSLTGTTIADASVLLIDPQDDDLVASTTSDDTGAYTIQVPGPLAVGSYQYSVVVLDQSGDISAPSNPVTLTIVGPPTSTVAALPLNTTKASFTVSWSGTAGAGATSIASYDVYVSDDGGPFVPFQTDTSATSATFTGQSGHTYGFYSVATDNFGDVQATPSGAQATTTVTIAGSLLPTSLSAVSGTGTFAGTGTLSATLTSDGAPVPGETVTFTLTSGTTTTTVGTATTNLNGVATLPPVSLTGFGAGTYPGAVGASFAPDTTYSGTGAGGELTVNRATPVVTWRNPAGIVYGTPLGTAQLDAAASAAGTFAYTPAAGTFLNAGQGQTLSAHFTPDDPADYNSVPITAQINVTPAPLTVTADNASIVAGQALPVFTASYSGFKRSDGPGVLGGVLGFSVPAGATGQASQYPITPGGLSASNYTISYVNGTLTVAPAPVPPVDVASARWKPIKTGRHKTVKGLVVTFSGALDPDDANDLAAYHLFVAGKGKKPGTRKEKTVGLASAKYNATADSVTLVPRGTVPKPPLQLALNPALLLDAQGRPLSGDVMLTLGKTGISLTSTAALRRAPRFRQRRSTRSCSATGGLRHENAIARREAPQPHGAGWLALHFRFGRSTISLQVGVVFRAATRLASRSVPGDTIAPLIRSLLFHFLILELDFDIIMP